MTESSGGVKNTEDKSRGRSKQTESRDVIDFLPGDTHMVDGFMKQSV